MPYNYSFNNFKNDVDSVIAGDKEIGKAQRKASIKKYKAESDAEIAKLEKERQQAETTNYWARAAGQFPYRAVEGYTDLASSIGDIAALAGDVTGIEPISKYGRKVNQFWQDAKNNETIQSVVGDSEFRGVQGLSKPETFIPTVIGEASAQIPNLVLSAAGAGVGGQAAKALAGKLLAQQAAKTGLVTTAINVSPNVVKAGQAAGAFGANLPQTGSYLEKLDAGADPQKAKVAAIRERGINTAFETVSDLFLFSKFNKLAENVAGKTISNKILNKLKNVGVNAGQQTITEGATEELQERETILEEKGLGINQKLNQKYGTTNAQRIIESRVVGGLMGGVFGGVAGATQKSAQQGEQVQTSTNSMTTVKRSSVVGGDPNFTQSSISAKNARVPGRNFPQITDQSIPQQKLEGKVYPQLTDTQLNIKVEDIKSDIEAASALMEALNGGVDMLGNELTEETADRYGQALNTFAQKIKGNEQFIKENNQLFPDSYDQAVSGNLITPNIDKQFTEQLVQGQTIQPDITPSFQDYDFRGDQYEEMFGVGSEIESKLFTLSADIEKLQNLQAKTKPKSARFNKIQSQIDELAQQYNYIISDLQSQDLLRNRPPVDAEALVQQQLAQPQPPIAYGDIMTPDEEQSRLQQQAAYEQMAQQGWGQEADTQAQIAELEKVALDKWKTPTERAEAAMLLQQLKGQSTDQQQQAQPVIPARIQAKIQEKTTKKLEKIEEDLTTKAVEEGLTPEEEQQLIQTSTALENIQKAKEEVKNVSTKNDTTTATTMQDNEALQPSRPIEQGMGVPISKQNKGTLAPAQSELQTGGAGVVEIKPGVIDKEHKAVSMEIVSKAIGKTPRQVQSYLNLHPEKLQDLVENSEDNIEEFLPHWKKYYPEVDLLEVNAAQKLAVEALSRLKQGSKSFVDIESKIEKDLDDQATYLYEKEQEYKKQAEELTSKTLKYFEEQYNKINDLVEAYTKAFVYLEDNLPETLPEEFSNTIYEALSNELEKRRESENISKESDKEGGQSRVQEERGKGSGQASQEVSEEEPKGDRTNIARQSSLVGLEQASEKTTNVQKQEVLDKEFKTKHTTTGKQVGMLNVDQFKNGQQILVDTATVGRGNKPSLSVKKMYKIEDTTDKQIKINRTWFAKSILEERGIETQNLEKGMIVYIDLGEKTDKQNVKKIENIAREYFGTTESFAEAGYILTDGELLDFSGKNQGGSSGRRNFDHREIASAFYTEDGNIIEDIGMNEFIDMGAIRFMPESNMLLMSRTPSSEQLGKIREFAEYSDGEIIIELVNEMKDWGNSTKRFYKEYEIGTSDNEIIYDIKNYYRGGHQSILKPYLSILGKDVILPEFSIMDRNFIKKLRIAKNGEVIGKVKDLFTDPANIIDDEKIQYILSLAKNVKIKKANLSQKEFFKGYSITGYFDGKDTIVIDTKLIKDDELQLLILHEVKHFEQFKNKRFTKEDKEYDNAIINRDFEVYENSSKEKDANDFANSVSNHINERIKNARRDKRDAQKSIRTHKSNGSHDKRINEGQSKNDERRSLQDSNRRNEQSTERGRYYYSRRAGLSNSYRETSEGRKRRRGSVFVGSKGRPTTKAKVIVEGVTSENDILYNQDLWSRMQPLLSKNEYTKNLYDFAVGKENNQIKEQVQHNKLIVDLEIELGTDLDNLIDIMEGRKAMPADPKKAKIISDLKNRLERQRKRIIDELVDGKYVKPRFENDFANIVKEVSEEFKTLKNVKQGMINRGENVVDIDNEILELVDESKRLESEFKKYSGNLTLNPVFSPEGTYIGDVSNKKDAPELLRKHMYKNWGIKDYFPHVFKGFFPVLADTKSGDKKFIGRATTISEAQGVLEKYKQEYPEKAKNLTDKLTLDVTYGYQDTDYVVLGLPDIAKVASQIKDKVEKLEESGIYEDTPYNVLKELKQTFVPEREVRKARRAGSTYERKGAEGWEKDPVKALTAHFANTEKFVNESEFLRKSATEMLRAKLSGVMAKQPNLYDAAIRYIEANAGAKYWDETAALQLTKTVFENLKLHNLINYNWYPNVMRKIRGYEYLAKLGLRVDNLLIQPALLGATVLPDLATEHGIQYFSEGVSLSAQLLFNDDLKKLIADSGILDTGFLASMEGRVDVLSNYFNNFKLLAQRAKRRKILPALGSFKDIALETIMLPFSLGDKAPRTVAFFGKLKALMDKADIKEFNKVPDDLVKEAAKYSNELNFKYSNTDAPSAFRSHAGKLMLQFKQYIVFYFGKMKDFLIDSLKGLNGLSKAIITGNKQEAVKQAGKVAKFPLSALLQYLMFGVGAIPFKEAIGWLIGLVFGRDPLMEIKQGSKFARYGIWGQLGIDVASSGQANIGELFPFEMEYGKIDVARANPAFGTASNIGRTAKEFTKGYDLAEKGLAIEEGLKREIPAVKRITEGKLLSFKKTEDSDKNFKKYQYSKYNSKLMKKVIDLQIKGEKNKAQSLIKRIAKSGYYDDLDSMERGYNRIKGNLITDDLKSLNNAVKNKEKGKTERLINVYSKKWYGGNVEALEQRFNEYLQRVN